MIFLDLWAGCAGPTAVVLDLGLFLVFVGAFLGLSGSDPSSSGYSGCLSDSSWPHFLPPSWIYWALANRHLPNT